MILQKMHAAADIVVLGVWEFWLAGDVMFEVLELWELSRASRWGCSVG
jgi:hypothetical protein